MLQSKYLTPNIWVEAINYVSHIQIQVPYKSFKGIYAFKTWSGWKLEVKHFRLVGFLAWALIPSNKNKALKPQSQEYIPLGFPHSDNDIPY